LTSGEMSDKVDIVSPALPGKHPRGSRGLKAIRGIQIGTAVQRLQEVRGEHLQRHSEMEQSEQGHIPLAMLDLTDGCPAEPGRGGQVRLPEATALPQRANGHPKEMQSRLRVVSRTPSSVAL
jgi:hypothetical protein